MASTAPPPAPAAAAAAPHSATAPSPLAQPVDSHSNRVDVINSAGGRILCVSDIRGAISTLNTLAAEHNAVAIIHSGDFGFYEPSSLASISDRTLRHLVQYSSLITPQFRSQLLAPNVSPLQLRELLARGPNPKAPASDDFFGLSEFPKLLSGDLVLNVPVYTVWGACEDVAILEKIRLAAPSLLNVPSDSSVIPPPPAPPVNGTRTTSGFSIPNLTILDEATTRVLLIGGVRLRLFGLGGAVVSHKLFDNGTGTATIAGGGGTMWTTVLQIGELVDTAQKVYDPTETRLLLTHASPGREGLLSQLCLVLKADLTLSAGLHFRYGVSYNEFSVQHDPEAFRNKLEAARKGFNEVWETVKGQVEGVVDANQKALLENALAVANRVPAAPAAGGQAIEESAWKNCWNWNLPDAAFGSLVLDIRDGRVGSEMKSQGFNFAYRANNARPTHPAAAPAAAAVPSTSTSASRPAAPTTNGPSAIAAPAPTKPVAPSLPSQQPQVPQQQPQGPSSRFPNANGPLAGPGGFRGPGSRGAGQQNPHLRQPSGPPPHHGQAPMGPKGHAQGGRFSGGWGSGGSTSGGEGAKGGSKRNAGSPRAGSPAPASPATEKKDEEKKSAAPLAASLAASLPLPGSDNEGVATTVKVDAKDAQATSSASAIAADNATTSSTTNSRPPSTRGPRQPRSNTKDSTATSGTEAAAAGESSGGEAVASPVSGAPSPFGGRGRGRGRGGRGRGGEFTGASRGPRGRGGKGPEGAAAGGGDGGEGGAPKTEAGATTPGGGESRKAGANGGGW